MEWGYERVSARMKQYKEGLALHCWFENGKTHEPRNAKCRELPEAGKGKARYSVPLPPEKNTAQLKP